MISLLLSKVTAKVWEWGAVVVAVLTAVSWVFLKGKQSAKQQAAAKQQKQDAKLQDAYNEIDARTPDLDASLDRLRKRSPTK